MSKCDLSITLDQPGRTYQPGETISGVVHVSVDKEVTCKGLSVVNQWRTHGRGNRDSANFEQEILFEGVWQPGTYEYPFSFTAQKEPFTYHGKLLNIDWYIHARADIPWSLDPKSSVDYLLEPETGYTRTIIEDFEESPLARFGSATGSPILLIVAILMIFAGGTIITAVVKAHGEVGPAIFGSVLALFGAIFTTIYIRKTMLQYALGDVDFEITPENSDTGASVNIGVAFRARGTINLNKISATLTGKEVVVSGSGTNRTTYRHTLYKKTAPILESYRITPGTQVSETGVLRIPIEAPPSFDAEDNKIAWVVTMHIDIAQWPDWKKSQPIILV